MNADERGSLRAPFRTPLSQPRGALGCARTDLRSSAFICGPFHKRTEHMRHARLLIVPVAVLVGLTVTGCNDLLVEDPKGFTTTDTFFKTGADLNSATIAIYNSLRGLQGQAPWTTPELASD